MDKYAQMKGCHYDHRLQVYMYAFMYVSPNILEEEEYFPTTKNIVANYKKMSTPGSVPKYWLGFSYIGSEDYKSDMKFVKQKLKVNQTIHPMIKLNHFAEILWSFRNNGLMVLI